MKNPNSKEEILTYINNVDSEKAKKALIRILSGYLSPAFGALPKRETEIIIFQVLQDLKIFNNNPDLYSLVSSLRVTRSKARNLLYESNLRKTSVIKLEDELLKLLKNPILLKNSDKICLEIDNPLLIDHLKHTLKNLNHITDGSFSPDLVKLTPEAYKVLLNNKFRKISKSEIDKGLVACGIKKEISVQSLLSGTLKKIGKKVADDAGDAAGEMIGDYLGDLFIGGIEKTKDFISSYKDNDLKKIES